MTWILPAFLGALASVLAMAVFSHFRRDKRERAPVRLAPLAPVKVPSGAPTAAGAAKTAEAPIARVTTYRGQGAALTSAGGARQAAKAAISRGDLRAAATHYRDAGLVDEAVNLLVGVLGAHAEAAAMLSERGDHERAADLFELAGRKAMAAREWAQVARLSPDPEPYLRRVRRLDPGLADALLAQAEEDDPDIHGAPTRTIRVSISDLPPPAEEEVAEEPESQEGALSMPDEEVDGLAAAAAEAVGRTFESLPPSGSAASAASSAHHGAPPPSAPLSGPLFASWTGGLEEELDPTSAAIIDEEVLRAGVAIPLWELEAMTRDQPCELSNIEVFHRIGMARLALGDWASALTAFDAVEEASPGYRDADVRAEQVRGWQLHLGSRRLLADGGLEVLGRFEERADVIVYRARDRVRDRDVLLHVPRRGPDPEFARRAAELAQLDHPNLTRVLAGVPLDGGGILCTETADGPTFTARIEIGPRPTVVEALRLAAQLCEAIEAGGSASKVIDPADLRVVPGGMLKVMRWGWSVDGEVAPSAFAAPELREGEGDGRALVFAVGAVFVLALTGDAALARSAHEEATWVAIRERAPYLPVAVRAVVERATARDPNARFPSIKGLRLALRNLLKQVQRRASSMTLRAVT